MDNSRFFGLVKERGVSQSHLCSLVDRNRHYLQDVKAGKSTPPEFHVRVWAEALNTTYEYLMGESDVCDPSPQKLNSMFHTSVMANMKREPKENPEVWVKPVESNQQKISELLGVIAKKPSAKKDMDDVLTYLEFIAKRGE